MKRKKKSREERATPEQVWRSAAERLDARMGPDSSEKAPVILLDVEAWTLRLDRQMVNTGNVVVVLTRARALFHAPSPFRLKVGHRNLFHRIAEAFGKEDVTLGRRDFDQEFTVRTDSSGRARSLLGRAGVVPVLLEHPTWHVEVSPATRSERRRLGSDLCAFLACCNGLITDEAELAALTELARELLEGLGDLGVASPQPVEPS